MSLDRPPVGPVKRDQTIAALELAFFCYVTDVPGARARLSGFQAALQDLFLFSVYYGAMGFCHHTFL